MDIHTETHTQAQIHIHIHVHTHEHIHIHTHNCTHTHTHTHTTHTHTHTLAHHMVLNTHNSPIQNSSPLQPQGIFVLYDLTMRESYDHVKVWLEDIEKVYPTPSPSLPLATWSPCQPSPLLHYAPPPHPPPSCHMVTMTPLPPAAACPTPSPSLLPHGYHDTPLPQYAPASGLEMMLIANKCDLEDRRQVTTTEGKGLAEEHKMAYIETSAESNHNITEVHSTPSLFPCFMLPYPHAQLWHV